MTLRRFEFSVCSANPKDLPPSLAQHASCWGLLHPHHFTFRTHVGGVVVADQVHIQLGGYLLVQLGQKLLELRGAVAAVDRSVDLAGGYVQGGEQRGDAMAKVVMRASYGQPGHHRQHRRRAVQGLDLGFLIHTEHQRLHRLSRPGARCRDYSRSVSPGRSPNPACASPRTGLSTVAAVRQWQQRSRGWGWWCPGSDTG